MMPARSIPVSLAMGNPARPISRQAWRGRGRYCKDPRSSAPSHTALAGETSTVTSLWR
jgi:hypothetical protein